jgi:transposase
VHQRWAEIQAMQTQGGAGLRNALLEADKLLDYIMQAKGFQGDTMGDRLKLNGDRFSDLNGIWTAHKLRNQIAHEVAIDIVKSQVEDAVRKLGRGIQDLGVTLS